MIISESTINRALQILEKAVDLLNENLIAKKYDEPVDKVLSKFEFVKEVKYSHAEFHRLTAAFVRALYRNVLGRRLFDDSSLDKVVSLLEETYRGEMGGYYGAVLEATDTSQSGIYCVLSRMAEFFKAKHRQMYVHWVAVRYIKFADWHIRCSLAAILIERCRAWMPHHLCRCPPEELADFIPELLNIYMSMNNLGYPQNFEILRKNPA